MEVIKEDEKDSNISNSVATNLKRMDTLVLDIAEDADSEA